MRQRSQLVILLSVLLIQSIALPAIAGLTDIPVTGTVKDRAGTGLAAVKVNYGTRQAWTDSSGNFTINLPAGQSFTLYATKTGLESESQSGTAWPGTEVHFEMYYKLNHWQSPSVFNNSSDVTITVTAKSYSPPASCIIWNDNASGSQVNLQLSNAVPGGESTWTGSYVVPDTRRDGNYSTYVNTRDCPSGIDLTYASFSNYQVDKIAPTIDSATIFPLDHGNTVYSSQPLHVKIVDTGSGVNPQSISFRLNNETSGTLITLGAASYNAQTGWAKTTSITLNLGTVYTVSVTASDYASNSSSAGHRPASDGGGFKFINITYGAAKATIETQGTNTGEAGSTLGSEKWVFDPVVALSDRVLEFPSGSHHTGWGTLATTVPLESARVTITTALRDHRTPRKMIIETRD